MGEKFVRTNLEDLEKDLITTGSEKILQLKEGDNRVRLIMTGGYLRYFAHFLPPELIPEDENLSFSSVLICLKEFNKDCPVCEYSQLLYNSTSEVDQVLAKKIYAKERYKFIVIDREETRDNVSPVKVLSCGRMIAESLEECRRNYGDPSDPERGYDLNINMRKVEGWNRYKVSPVVKLVEKEGKRTLELVETPLTEEERKYSLPNLEDFIFEPVVEDVHSIFDPLILEKSKEVLKEELPVEKETSLPSFGKSLVKPTTHTTEAVSDKQLVLKEKEAVAKQSEKQLFTENKASVSDTVKYPRCFGMYDPEDEENCGSCLHKEACKKKTESISFK